MLEFVLRPAISAGKGVHSMQLMRTMVLVMVLSALVQGGAQQTQAPKPAPSLVQISVKVGWAIGALDMRGAQVKQPPVDPIEGATVVLLDKDGVIAGIRITDKEGLSYWPYQAEDFSVSVILVGRKMNNFKFAGGEKTASVLIRLDRNK